MRGKRVYGLVSASSKWAGLGSIGLATWVIEGVKTCRLGPTAVTVREGERKNVMNEATERREGGSGELTVDEKKKGGSEEVVEAYLWIRTAVNITGAHHDKYDDAVRYINMTSGS